ncbi:hypothetical protein C8K36_102459 [Rhodococcus sp. OK519]|uniref:hypothetical protein n=1 Tax=Rhodococcus sp. OK519 TaxID=2135729 RepID=UPI000D337EDF|nr:hypothetical protein C8K36_102459 [Rhodococcus sp. OK519]
MTSIELKIKGDTTPEIRDLIAKLQGELEDAEIDYELTYGKPLAAPRPSPQVHPGQTWSVPATHPYPDPSKWTPMPDPLKPVQVWCGTTATDKAPAGQGSYTMNN